MDKTQILLFSAFVVVLAIRLYMRYKKKTKIEPGSETKTSASTSFPSTSKDEEYEPYSKK